MTAPIDLSVLIPVYATTEEHVGWLREAVASVKSQGHPAQILIADDASPAPLGDLDGAVVHRLTEHKGVCQARNFLGHECKTPYLLFLDADDRLYEGALAKMVERATPKRVVYGNLMLTGNGHAARYFAFKDYNCQELLRKAIIPVTSLHTKAAFEQVHGFDSDFEEGLEDWDYNIRLMLAGFCGEHISEPLLWYRRHEGQRSAKGRNWLWRQSAKLLDRYSSLEKEEIGVPCCGGGGRSSVAGNPGVARMAAGMSAADVASGEMVLIEYTGSHSGTFGVKGKATGTVYRFGGAHREKYVWPRDVQDLVRLPYFRLGMRRQEIPVAQPDVSLLEREAQPGEGKPAVPDDLTAIKGLGRKRAERLAQNGILRFENLAAAGPKAITEMLPGIGLVQAEAFVAEARRLVK